MTQGLLRCAIFTVVVSAFLVTVFHAPSSIAVAHTRSGLAVTALGAAAAAPLALQSGPSADLGFLEDALALLEEEDDELGQAIVHFLIGRIQIALSDYDEALE